MTIKKLLIILLIISFNLTFCYNTAFATSFIVDGVRVNKKVKTFKELKSKGIVHQSLDFSCGAAGLSTLFNYHLNDPRSEKDIISQLLQYVDLQKVKARKGFSLLDLKKYVEAIGYKATGYKMDFEFLSELKRPVLVPIKFKNYRHFVIVKAIIGDRVYIADPAVGNMTMKYTKFETMWLKGIGLVVEREGMTDEDYAKAFSEEDAVFADYKHINRSIPKTALRTAIFPNEFVNR